MATMGNVAEIRGMARYNESAPTEAWNSPQGLTTRPEKAGSKMAAADHITLHPSALDAYPIPDRLRERLLRFVRVDDGCWRWVGGTRVHGGYVQVRHGSGPKQLAHRLVYSHAVGPIPEGLQLDHLCRVADCCRPDHLEAVTAAENIRRRDDARRKRETERAAEVDYWRTRALRAEALLRDALLGDSE